MNILEILEGNDTLCMDDEDDRATLAQALKDGLVDELTDLGFNGYVTEQLFAHIKLMPVR